MLNPAQPEVRLSADQAIIYHAEWLRHPVTLELLRFLATEAAEAANRAEAARRDAEACRQHLDRRYYTRYMTELLRSGNFLSANRTAST